MTDDTTEALRGRERADSEPLTARLRVGRGKSGTQEILLDLGDGWGRLVLADYNVADRLRPVAWPLLVAAITDAEKLRVERDEARAAHAALLADVEALRESYSGTPTDLPVKRSVTRRHVAAVIAKHAPKEAER